MTAESTVSCLKITGSFYRPYHSGWWIRQTSLYNSSSGARKWRKKPGSGEPLKKKKKKVKEEQVISCPSVTFYHFQLKPWLLKIQVIRILEYDCIIINQWVGIPSSRYGKFIREPFWCRRWYYQAFLNTITSVGAYNRKSSVRIRKGPRCGSGIHGMLIKHRPGSRYQWNSVLLFAADTEPI